MFTQRIFIGIFSFVFAISLNAQAPDAFSFQGVAYDNSGNPIGDQDINVLVEILQDASASSSIYSEEHAVMTNPSGLFVLQIGRGSVPSSSFANINWGASSHFIKVGIDTEGDGEYSIMGITELLSVPYALYAESSTVKPSFIVDYNGKRGPTQLSLTKQKFTSNSSVFAQVFQFQWIDGLPQNVYIDYVGLPDNLCLMPRSLNNIRRHEEDISINYSGVDTIFDGLHNPLSELVLCEEGILPEAGEYKVNQYFRLNDIIYDSLYFDMTIYDSNLEACFPNGSITYSYKETTCDSIPDHLVTSIIVDPIGNSEVSVTAPIDTLGLFTKGFSFPRCMSDINEFWYVFDEYSLYPWTTMDIDLRGSEETIICNFFRNTLSGGSPGTNHCEVVYEREE